MPSATLTRAPALTGARRLGWAAALLALATGAWILTADRMRGMDAGPGTDLGGLGWFVVSWLVMMAAMMLPSLVPAALRTARSGERRAGGFVLGYLAAWTAAGVGAYAVVQVVRGLGVGWLAWDRGGRAVAAGVILSAAAYQLTSVKRACLDRCRTAQRLSPAGGLRGGVRHGAACIGCCTGLMAALFALGVMSLQWMAAVGALIAAERLATWRAPAVYGVAAALLVLGLWVAVDPGSLPGLTLPGAMGSM